MTVVSISSTGIFVFAIWRYVNDLGLDIRYFSFSDSVFHLVLIPSSLGLSLIGMVTIIISPSLAFLTFHYGNKFNLKVVCLRVIIIAMVIFLTFLVVLNYIDFVSGFSAGWTIGGILFLMVLLSLLMNLFKGHQNYKEMIGTIIAGMFTVLSCLAIYRVTEFFLPSPQNNFLSILFYSFSIALFYIFLIVPSLFIINEKTRKFWYLFPLAVTLFSCVFLGKYIVHGALKISGFNYFHVNDYLVVDDKLSKEWFDEELWDSRKKNDGYFVITAVNVSFTSTNSLLLCPEIVKEKYKQYISIQYLFDDEKNMLIQEQLKSAFSYCYSFDKSQVIVLPKKEELSEIAI
ncbi:hypothetical protein [Xanthomarina gelatinilytica]|uniref:hypothetical protein n=1 Tax=Xanthomarina gelatinilytica TaxID=1137281 RepID=UPI003AA855A2